MSEIVNASTRLTIFSCQATIIIIIIIILIIIISISKEDNVFGMIASLPYGPPVNTDIDCYRTFFYFFVRVAMLVVRYLFGEEKPVLAL